MSDFAVKILPVRNVRDHPDADRLSIMDVLGYIVISAKLEDGTHRYRDGDLVAYVPEGAVVPEYLLRQGFWDEKNQKGILAGSKGDRVKAKRLRGVFSQGIMFPTVGFGTGDFAILGKEGVYVHVKEGDDVAADLGIIKYEPPIPVGMAGEVCSIFGNTMKYDFESIQSIPNMFDDGDEVVATEKLHGTFMTIGLVPGLGHPELFGDGDLYVGSKGLSAKGLVMKNNEANVGNLYVRMLNALLEVGLLENLRAVLDEKGDMSIRLFGEVYGKGVQDLAYGRTDQTFALFDVAIGNHFVSYDEMVALANRLGVPVVPTLYEGPFDRTALEAVRDGKDTLSGTNVREGIVIKSRTESRHPEHGRRIAKWVSPAYLERKGGTEFQ